MELHTSRRAGEERRKPVFWLRFCWNSVERVLPVSQDRALEMLDDEELGRLLDSAEPNLPGMDVAYHVSPDPEQDRGSSWISRARVFLSNESEAWEENVSDPEGVRFSTYQEAERRSRMLGEAYVRRQFVRSKHGE